MRIWICVTGEPLPTDSNDVRLRRMGNFAIYASNCGHKIEWFCDSFEHYTKKQRCNKDTDIIFNSNLTIHLIKGIGYKRNISFRRIFSQTINSRRTIRRINQLTIDDPDIIITPLAHVARSTNLIDYAKEKNIPIVIDVRDLWPEVFFDVIPWKLHFFIKPFVKSCEKKLRYSLSRTSGIIGLSPGFLQYGLNYAGRAKNKNDAIIPIGYPDYNYSDYSNKFDSCWSNVGVNDNDFIITFLGNFGDQFNFEPIIEASKILENNKKIKFVLCGTGHQLETIKKMAEDNVIFPGWIEKEKIASLLCHSKIGIIPYIQSKNYKLNTPNKFGEYLSASLPILVSVDGVMEQYATDYQCGFHYKDGRDLANKINIYFKNNELREKHANNARKLYLRVFNVEEINHKLIKHFNQVVQSYKMEDKEK